MATSTPSERAWATASARLAPDFKTTMYWPATVAVTLAAPFEDATEPPRTATTHRPPTTTRRAFMPASQGRLPWLDRSPLRLVLQDPGRVRRTPGGYERPNSSSQHSRQNSTTSGGSRYCAPRRMNAAARHAVGLISWWRP